MTTKPAATSAASTAFCAEKVFGPRGHLWIDGNGKITRDNGTLDAPKPNAFSLVQINDCPQATDLCKRACYVHGLEKHAPQVHALYRHNSEMIHRIIYSSFLASQWVAPMAQWIEENCRGGFRWHVSGDVFCKGYAEWIASVCFSAPKVPFWIYTRSFEYVETLIDVCTVDGGNLAINLSCDEDNYHAARHLIDTLKKPLRLCFLSTSGWVPGDLPDGSVIFPDYSLRGGTVQGLAWFDALSSDQKSFVCPVDYHGKSENRRCGPCARCLT